MQWKLNSIVFVVGVGVVIVVVVRYQANLIQAEGLGTWPKNGLFSCKQSLGRPGSQLDGRICTKSML